MTIVSGANCHWNSHESPQFQYYDHVYGCSVRCANGTRNLEMIVSIFVHMTSEKPSLGSICATFCNDLQNLSSKTDTVENN